MIKFIVEKFLKFLVGLLFYSSFCFSNGAKPYVIQHCRQHAGMFSIFNDVLALLKGFDKGIYQGIEVNFFKEGCYYSESHGENWWTYYCDPIQFGLKNNVINVLGRPPGARIFESEFLTSRYEAYYLINKYIHFKPSIKSKVEDFVYDNFHGYYVVGVHYRGTDKIKEAPRVSYEDIIFKIEEVIQQISDIKYKIFVATDEIEFIDQLYARYGKQVCFNKEAIRTSGNIPLHKSEYDRYKCGLDAILDMVLLSRCNYLIRTSSNLSKWSTFFNPEIPVFQINYRKIEAIRCANKSQEQSIF